MSNFQPLLLIPAPAETYNVTAVPSVLLAAPTSGSRRLLSIQNSSETETVYLDTADSEDSNTVSASKHHHKIGPGAEYPFVLYIPQGQIYAVATGNCNVSITYFDA